MKERRKLKRREDWDRRSELNMAVLVGRLTSAQAEVKLEEWEERKERVRHQAQVHDRAARKKPWMVLVQVDVRGIEDRFQEFKEVTVSGFEAKLVEQRSEFEGRLREVEERWEQKLAEKKRKCESRGEVREEGEGGGEVEESGGRSRNAATGPRVRFSNNASRNEVRSFRKAGGEGGLALDGSKRCRPRGVRCLSASSMGPPLLQAPPDPS
jgi:hypothetical protein